MILFRAQASGKSRRIGVDLVVHADPHQAKSGTHSSRTGAAVPPRTEEQPSWESNDYRARHAISPPADRQDYWSAGIAEYFFSMRVDDLGPSFFEARLAHGQAGPVAVRSIQGRPHRVARTSQMIASVDPEAVLRAQAAGFDGIELGAHMRYLYSSFLSPRTNWREDEYGGSAENRARILTDTIRAIRAEVGPDYPVGLRMSANDHLVDGQGAEGFAEVAAIIAKAGLRYIALTDGNYESMDENVSSRSGTMLEHGEPQAFRRAIPDVPLLLSSTYDPQQGADAITAGHGDGIMLARQLLADPEFPRKVLEGRQEEVLWCDHNNSCLRRLVLNVPVRCTKNPEMGREAELAGAPVSVSVKLRRPAENALIAATGSPLLMGIADRLASAKPVQKS